MWLSCNTAYAEFDIVTGHILGLLASSKIVRIAGTISWSSFFFGGDGAHVKCWYCNGGLHEWEYDDKPWIEHTKWYSTCEYLLCEKGPGLRS